MSQSNIGKISENLVRDITECEDRECGLAASRMLEDFFNLLKDAAMNVYAENIWILLWNVHTCGAGKALARTAWLENQIRRVISEGDVDDIQEILWQKGLDPSLRKLALKKLKERDEE